MAWRLLSGPQFPFARFGVRRRPSSARRGSRTGISGRGSVEESDGRVMSVTTLMDLWNYVLLPLTAALLPFAL